jgi:selenocysteine lyase/cysteine desulfurase
VAKLVGLLGLGAAPVGPRPVVFVGPFEHHSNLLPWRESAAEVVPIGEDGDGRVDLAELEAQLVRRAVPAHPGARAPPRRRRPQGRRVLLAAQVRRRPPDPRGAGRAPRAGPQPGPDVPGGGTIAFVDPVGHRYLDDPVAREEGGTPAIVESIRAGLVVALKQAVGTDLIQDRERRLLHRALARWRANPNLELLGNLEAPRLPIVSFRVRHGDRYLHHELVVALLNDLFGIQARGGCSCAGPYGHRLLGEYRFDPRGGQWRHQLAPADPELSLDDLLEGLAPAPRLGEEALARHLREARAILAAAPVPGLAPAATPATLPPALERLRDFHLPSAPSPV